VITRRSVLLAGGIGLLVAHRLSRGQPAATTRRVGMISSASEAAGAHLRAALKQGMRDLGWVEGKDVEYRFVYADGHADRLDALAGELIGQKFDVIVTASTSATRAAQRATKTIPIVMTNVSNAERTGLIVSLSRPGGNTTGITSRQDEVLGKVIEILHAVTPGARRIAILLNEGNPSYAENWAAAQSACAALDLVALRVVAAAPAQFGAAVEQIVRQRSQAVVVVQDGMFFTERAKLQELMQTTRLPVAYQNRDYVVEGGLLSYATDLAASFRYAAKYVDRILKGSKPADLPVEQPTKFELVINMKTAKALGLTIPQSVLLRADEVIQ
jgi:putative tryptophan/tyrosine transport system substrate-binding protein